MTIDITNPTTLGEWWDYIQTDSSALKTRYFFRNYSAICSNLDCTLHELLMFLGTKAKLTQHSKNDPKKYSNSFSLVSETYEFTFRLDPTTPTINGSRPYPSIVLCSAYGLSAESGKWVNIL